MGYSYVDIVAVPDAIGHSGVRGTADPPAAGQLMMHSEVSGEWENGRQDHTSDDKMPLDIRTEDQRLSPDDEEAIVVGAVGSAAPWFLTGWADEVEIACMIDMGCQVTISVTSLFERMCDSPPLTVKEELELTLVFPGLSCDMILVVVSIGSDGLLGTEALQSCLPHQLDLRMGQLWAEGQSTLQLHQQRLAPNVKAFLKTSVVLPPDSEIVAPISVRASGRDLVHW